MKQPSVTFPQLLTFLLMTTDILLQAFTICFKFTIQPLVQLHPVRRNTYFSSQVLIKFKPVPGAIMGEMDGMTNELVIRLQPDEAIYMSIVNKKPGLTSELTKTNLMLSYKSEWDEAKDLPDAYERLILDALNQEKALFCRDDELKV